PAEAAGTEEAHDSVLGLIGNTPLIKLSRLQGSGKAGIFAKLEYHNPGGSVKDRTGLAMIEAAEAQGLLKPGATLVEPTYGNAGIGLAIAAKLKGYRLVCTVPERVSPEKINLLKAYGAKVILTPSDLPDDHPGNYRRVAERIARETPGAFMPNQYFNEANPLIHYRTTGPEIWRQTGKRVDVLVAGMGTGGTISGAGRFLKERNPGLKLVGVDPQGSRYQGDFTGVPAEVRPYKMEGVGQNFLPGTLSLGLIDEVISITDGEAFAAARRLALEEGVLAGGSAGAAVAAALRIASGWAAGKRIVVVLPDDGRNYLSRIYSDEWMRDQGFLEGRKGIPVSEILSKKPFRFRRLHFVHPQDPARKAITLLLANDISQLPVFEGGTQVGCVAQQALAEKLSDFEAEGRGDAGSFGDLKVAQVMGLPLPSVQTASSLASPFGFFREHRALLILEGREPVGILTLSDVVQYHLRS
ncbi:MAG TPA: pyridoxal-phosphate dependent enzyme, partial [Fibrobacteria bacterium]|nr:pyridoxal-phosphate dependent enzyme [Fibrobacteria bacterium]